jgi:hypothetical protein
MQQTPGKKILLPAPSLSYLSGFCLARFIDSKVDKQLKMAPH